MTIFTHFWDMHSGGGSKEDFNHIYIEAPEEEAKVIFYNRFGHNPERVSCTCCGEDYSISECGTVLEGSGFHRNCASVYVYKDTGEEAADGWASRRGSEVEFDHDLREWVHNGRPVEHAYVERPDLHHMEYGASKKECEDRYQTLEEYLASGDVLVIHADEIEPHERIGRVPEQGYVWME